MKEVSTSLSLCLFFSQWWSIIQTEQFVHSYRSWYILINLDTMSSEAGTKQVSHFKGASPKSLESLDSACQGKRQGKRRLMVNAKFVLPASTINNLRIPITNFFAPQWFQFFIRVFSARDLRKIRLLRFAWPWNHAAGCCDGGRFGKPQAPSPASVILK